MLCYCLYKRFERQRNEREEREKQEKEMGRETGKEERATVERPDRDRG